MYSQQITNEHNKIVPQQASGSGHSCVNDVIVGQCTVKSRCKTHTHTPNTNNNDMYYWLLYNNYTRKQEYMYVWFKNKCVESWTKSLLPVLTRNIYKIAFRKGDLHGNILNCDTQNAMHLFDILFFENILYISYRLLFTWIMISIAIRHA